mmetsp:Transcript_8216/g.14881  ORF Transcript_8216/g.14881 Transcript_8216/m.14881 type:complete len:140 (+) Transcript_8216:3-422(+)
MQNKGSVPWQQPPASFTGSRSMLDTTSSTSHHGFQDPAGHYSSTFSRTSFQTLRNDVYTSMGTHQQTPNRLQQQQQGSRGYNNPYPTALISFANNTLNSSFVSGTLALSYSVDTSFTSQGTGSFFSKLKSEVKSASELI